MLYRLVHTSLESTRTAGRASRCAGTLVSRLAAGVVALAVATSACASTSSLTVIPLRGKAAEQVDRDRAECDAIGAQARDRWAFVKTKVGAVIAGVVLGAAVGLLLTPGTSISPQEAPAMVAGAMAAGAAVGFVLGEIGGTVAGLEEHRRSESAYLDRYMLCLNYRGYEVRP